MPHPVPQGPPVTPSLSWTCDSSLCPRAAPERKLASFWYNVTVLVKMDFMELQQVDPRLLDHMRLLHSMVGGGVSGGVPQETPTDWL